MSFNRTNTAGFTLFETLIGFAILSLMVVTFYQVGINTTTTYTKRQRDYEVTEFARSKLDELVALELQTSSTGQYKDTWEWSAKITPAPEVPASYLAKTHQVVRITLIAWPVGQEHHSITLSANDMRRRK